MEWISVKDNLPNIGEKVLIAFRDGSGYIIDTAQRVNGGWDVTNWEVSEHLIKFWLSIPEPPGGSD